MVFNAWSRSSLYKFAQVTLFSDICRYVWELKQIFSAGLQIVWRNFPFCIYIFLIIVENVKSRADSIRSSRWFRVSGTTLHRIVNILVWIKELSNTIKEPRVTLIFTSIAFTSSYSHLLCNNIMKMGAQLKMPNLVWSSTCFGVVQIWWSNTRFSHHTAKRG